MARFFRRTFLVTVLAGLVGACTQPDEPDQARQAERLALETLRFEKVESCPAGGHGLALTPCAAFVATYPQIVAGPTARVRSRLDAAIRELLTFSSEAKDLEGAATAWLDPWKLDQDLESLDPQRSPWYRFLRVEIDYVDSRTLSLRLTEVEVRAGLAPLVLETIASFSLEDGRRYSLSDLFQGDDLEPLQRVGQEVASARRLTLAGSSAFLSNFAIAEHGVIFHFHPGELDRKAVDLALPYERLRQLINRRGPLADR
jgi:hypothetical protein